MFDNPLQQSAVSFDNQIKRVLTEFAQQEPSINLESYANGTTYNTFFRWDQLTVCTTYDRKAIFLAEDFVKLVQPEGMDSANEQYGLVIITSKTQYDPKRSISDIQLVEFVVYVNNTSYGKLHLDGYIRLCSMLLASDEIGNPDFGELWMKYGLIPRRYRITPIRNGGSLSANLADKLLLCSIILEVEQFK